MNLTASKVELALACPGSFALPHTDVRTPEAEAGKALHEKDEAAIKSGNVPEAFTDRWPGLTWRAEVKFAYDVATGEGRELGTGTDRDYSSINPFEIAGTADVVGTAPGKLVVIDRKSFDPNVSRAAQNAQLHILALAASRSLGLDHADVAIMHEVRGLDVAALDVLDLDLFASEIRTLLLSVARERKSARDGLPITLKTGKHCRWCNAFAACPKQGELMELVKTDGGQLDPGSRMLISLERDEDAAEAYLFAGRVSMLLKRLNSALYARASERPIPIGNGKMFGKVATLGNEKLDGDVVYQVVKEKHGQAIADTAVIRSATKTRLKEALGFVGGKVAANERDVLDEVRLRGGSRKDSKETVEEFVPQLKVAGT